MKDCNINILKTDLDLQNSNRRAKLILEIINNKKDQFQAINDNTQIKIGDSYTKATKFLGDPLEVKHRTNNNESYFMVLYNFNNNNYRLFFEGDILFDIMKEEKWKNI